MLPQCTTVARIWRSRSLRRRPIRTSQFNRGPVIGFSYSGSGIFDIPHISDQADCDASSRHWKKRGDKVMRSVAFTISALALPLCVAGSLDAVLAQTAKDLAGTWTWV